MYRIITSDFLKSIKELEKATIILIKKYIDNNIQNTTNPKVKGKPLMQNLIDYWRYIIGGYRLICNMIESDIAII